MKIETIKITIEYDTSIIQEELGLIEPEHAIGLLTEKINEIIETMNEFDKKLSEVSKLSDITNITDLTKEYAKISERVKYEKNTI